MKDLEQALERFTAAALIGRTVLAARMAATVLFVRLTPGGKPRFPVAGYRVAVEAMANTTVLVRMHRRSRWALGVLHAWQWLRVRRIARQVSRNMRLPKAKVRVQW